MTLQITVYETTGSRYHAYAGSKSITGNRLQIIQETEKWIKDYLDNHPVELPPSK